MTTATHPSKWRNFASWSAAGAIPIVGAVIAAWLIKGIPLDEVLRSDPDPKVVVALLLSMAVVGLTSRNTPFTWRALRNFVILGATASAVAILAISGVRAGFGPLGLSQWVAVGTGLALVFLAAFFSLAMAAGRKGWNLVEPEQLEILRERSRLTFLSWTAVATMGLMLVVLALAGPGGAVPPAAALAGVLALLAATTALTIACWRLMDELDRTLSYEAGNLAFYLLLLLGGGWAVLAHLAYVPAAAPLDWLTMLTVVSFPASVIAAGRRKLLTQR